MGDCARYCEPWRGAAGCSLAWHVAAWLLLDRHSGDHLRREEPNHGWASCWLLQPGMVWEGEGEVLGNAVGWRMWP